MEQETKAATLYKFTNYAESPELDDVLAMFYHGVFTNRIGIMQAMNIETGETEIVLVGITLDENGKPDCYPLAKCLKAEEVSAYHAPDGLGGYYDLTDPSDVARGKENMKPADQATVESGETVFPAEVYE